MSNSDQSYTPYGAGEGAIMPLPEVEATRAPGSRGGCVIYLHSDRVGSDTGGHGGILMRDALYALTETAPQLAAIVLVNSAVRLAQAGSAALECLSLLEGQGVRILLVDSSVREFCGGSGIATGKQVTMHAILQTLAQAEKVVTL
ncbi:MAG: hypothetical protein NT045_07930 [Candidatus Aureabacteria bacterium]|nr:hypothetical protein [Candidatus Auribacterota bacterium]